MDVFVYGTLCWDALLWRVSGRDDLTVVPAQLPGHRTHWAAGQAFPMIAPVAGASAPGLLVLDVDPSVLERLDHYEGGFDYQLQSRPVVCQDQTVDAQVYIPPAEIAPGDLWDLAAWRNTHGALAFEAAIEVMARLGQDAPKQMAAKYPMMQVRASQRLAAQA
ncbi:MAG: gamma-glutamylcyclotransferase family protein, partial [Pseudomonadota bacterium]